MVAVAAMADWPRNKGAEAIATHPRDGTVIIGGNKTGKSGLHPLLWYRGEPAQTKPDILKFQAPKGYSPADAAFLDDGRLLVINRRYNPVEGYSTILTISNPLELHKARTVSATHLLRIASSALAANYEAMTVRHHAKGTTIWLASDNNFFPRRPTKLLKLEFESI